MNLDPDACYQALLTHDARFDGAFFVGVSSTGIYCRTVCPARTPRRDHCAFFPGAAAAERAGYRPCLRCRPELAPGNARIDSAGRLAAHAMSRIEDGALSGDGAGVADLARSLGVSDRHLRRVVWDEFGVAPVALAQTARLLLAKRLLTDTRLPVTEVALSSGFGSVRRFNTLFRERYRLNPTQLRRAGAGDGVQGETLLCRVAFRPPLDSHSLLAALAPPVPDGCETAGGGVWRHTVAGGWVAAQVEEARNTVRVELPAALAPHLSQILARVKRCFDLAARPDVIAAHLGDLAANNPGLRLPGAFDGWAIAARLTAGPEAWANLVAAWGEPVETPWPDLCRVAPPAVCILALSPGALACAGVIEPATLLALAGAIAAGRLRLDGTAPAQREIATLETLPGLPADTIARIAARCCGWPDAFPAHDPQLWDAAGAHSAAALQSLADPWRPWRTYAALHLLHRTGETL